VRRECRKNADATQCGQYDGFAAACRAVGRDIKDFDVCKMSYLGVAPDAAGARVMLDELATRYNTTPATLTEQMVVATPDEIAERLRTLTENRDQSPHFLAAEIAALANYLDALELLARELVPRVRA